MVIRIRKTIEFSLLLVFSSMLLWSCEQTVSEEDCETYNYYDCTTQEPYSAELKMKFSINKNVRWVAFAIYKGGFDENNVIVYDTAWDSSVIYDMPIPEYYSVRAIYKIDGKTIYTIDGIKMDKKSVQKCDSICWKEVNKELDLTIH